MQLHDALRECPDIVEVHHEARLPARQEIRLAAVIEADDRKAICHGLQEYQAEPLVLTRRDKNIGARERLKFTLLRNLTRQVHMIGEAGLRRGTPDRLGVGPIPDDQQMRVGARCGFQRLNQQRRRLARDHAADGHHDEGVLRQPKRAARAQGPRRPLDAERDQLRGAVHAVEGLDMLQGVARLPHQPVRSP